MFHSLWKYEEVEIAKKDGKTAIKERCEFIVAHQYIVLLNQISEQLHFISAAEVPIDNEKKAAR